MALQFIMAGAQLAMGAGKAFMGHSAQQEAYNRAKSQARRQNELQRSQLSSNYTENIRGIMDQQAHIAEVFGAKVAQGQADIQFTQQYAGDVYRLRQQRLNDTFAQAAFSDQDRAVRLAQSQGMMAAAGRTGRTAARFDVANLAQAGRNRAIQAKELTGHVDTFNQQSEIDNRRFAHQIDSIAARTSVLPRFGRIPPVPTMPTMPSVGPRPSNMGLYMGLAQAGMSAVSTFNQFSPQGPKLDKLPKPERLGFGDSIYG